MTVREKIALAAILTLAAVLAFQHLSLQSLWLDETWSVYMATVEPGMFKHRLKTREANMSLYYVLLRGWVAVFGTSESAVRALSAVFATGAVAALYALARLLFGVASALSAAFLLAVNSFHVYYAHDARSYSLVELLVTLAALALVLIVVRPTWPRAAGYAAVAAASLYAHFFAALALAGQALALPVLGVRRLPWRHLAAAFGGAAILGAPLAAFVILRDVGQVDTIPPVGPRDAITLVVQLAGGAVLALLYGGLALDTLVRTWRDRRSPLRARWACTMALLWLLFPPAVAYAISLVKPLFVERYLIVALPGWVLLAGAGLARLPRPWVYAAALAVVVVLALGPGGRWHERGITEDWRGATRYVLSSSEPGDALVFYAAPVRHAFDYYRARSGGMDGPPETVFPRWEAYRNEPTQAFLDSLPARHRRVWLVLSHHLAIGREAGLRSVTDALDREYPARSATVFENIEVRLYGR